MVRRADRHLADTFYVIGGQTAPSCARREREVQAFDTADMIPPDGLSGSSQLLEVPMDKSRQICNPGPQKRGALIIFFNFYEEYNNVTAAEVVDREFEHIEMQMKIVVVVIEITN